MKVWKFLTIACLVVKFVSCSIENKQCSWLLDAVERDNLWKVAPRIIRTGQYFLRIRVKCNEMINSEMLRSLVLTGVNPLIKIETEEFGINHHNARRLSILISPVLIEMGDDHDCGCLLMNKSSGNNWTSKCFCDGLKPSCSHYQATSMAAEGISCCQIEKNCSRFTELCNPAWVAPLYIPELATALHCEVIDSGIGPYINSHRFTVHLDGFHLSVNGTFYNRLGKEVMQLPSLNQQTPVNCLPGLSPVCIIASYQMENRIIYTNSEFETMHFAKIQFQTTVENKCVSEQSLSSVTVKGTLSLSDRIFLNTGAGLLEMQADHANIFGDAGSKGYAIVLSACVSHVVGPAQPSVHSVTVLGFGEEQDQEKIFVASPMHRKPSEFKEQKDSNGLNACQFLRSQLQNTDNYPCQAITGSASSVMADSFVILVRLKTPHTDTHHLLLLKGPSSTGPSWRVLFHLPTALAFQAKGHDSWETIESKFSNQVPQASLLRLSGLSFTAVVCKSLFLWGNALLYSPDGGISIHWLTSFPGNSTILVFTSSPFDGAFAFLTDTQEVWIGQSGSANVQRLDSSMVPKALSPGLYDQIGAFVVSIFFDSGGRLQQIVAEQDPSSETKCISREELPIGKIISWQIFAQKQQESTNAYIKSKTSSPTSCIKKQPKTQSRLTNVQRTCPFASISFEARHDVLYTRRCFYKFEPSLQLGSGLVQQSTTIHEYFTRVYSTVDSDCTGSSKDSWQLMRDYLPELIHLGRSECYSFVFYLYLDYEFNVDTSSHAWNLIHLQASFHVSDAGVLNITCKRIELIPKKAVKYEVTVQDSGLRLPQYRSGEGLTPASVHIQVWNSGLSCSTSYGSRGSLEGSYVMTLMLGCPVGLKLVFDPEASKNASGRKHFCSDVHGVPCFYFYRDFLPVFKLLDLATGKIKQFHGKYRLKIVGGGPAYQEITDYTVEEQIKYNYQTTSSMASLIWASKLKTLGDIPVFTSKTNGISWLCGTQSPCADVGPTFPGNAEYYFKLEFSNRVVDADSSNCDFTTRFIIRVHGLPPGSFNPSSVIVLSCIGILATLILTMFALKRREVKLWVRLRSVFAEVIYHRCRDTIKTLRQKRKVDILPNNFELETVDQDKIVNKGSESDAAVSVDIRGQAAVHPTHSETSA